MLLANIAMLITTIQHRPRIPRIDTNWQIFGFVAESFSVREDLN